MRYCPECGREVVLRDVKSDMDTDHHQYLCPIGHSWCETIDRYGGPSHITEMAKEMV